MIHFKKGIGAVAVVAACATSACQSDVSCTAIGCVDGVGIDLGQLDGTDPLSISIDADTTHYDCEASLQSNAGNCAGTPLTLYSNNGSYSLRLEGAHPKTLTIVISQSGREILNETVTPAYVQSQPNGPDCPPTCNWASI